MVAGPRCRPEAGRGRANRRNHLCRMKQGCRWRGNVSRPYRRSHCFHEQQRSQAKPHCAVPTRQSAGVRIASRTSRGCLGVPAPQVRHSPGSPGMLRHSLSFASMFVPSLVDSPTKSLPDGRKKSAAPKAPGITPPARPSGLSGGPTAGRQPVAGPRCRGRPQN